MAAALSTTAKPPEPLNLDDRQHHGENWKYFKRSWKYYEIAAAIFKKSEEIRVCSLLNVIGKDGVDMYETFHWDAEGDDFKIDKVLEKFEERCVPARNETYERYIFFKREQSSSESLDSYITTLIKLSETCGFGDLRESLVRDRLILGVKDDKVREKLLGKRDLTLDRAIEILKASEVTHYRATEISEESSAHENINSTRRRQPKSKPVSSAHGVKSKPVSSARPASSNPSQPSKKSIGDDQECKFCGRNHPMDRNKCPAFGQKCNNCGKKGHFAAKCRSQRINLVESEAPEEAFYVNNITGKDEALVSLRVNDAAVIKFQVDTGSTANILPFQEYVRATKDCSGDKIDHRNITLVMHDQSKSKALGRVRLRVEHMGSKHDLNFIVVDMVVKPLLGFKTSQGMGLVRLMNCDDEHPPVITQSVEEIHGPSDDVMNDTVLSEYADVFCGLGCLPGEYSITLDETVQPVVHAPRRVPAPKREAVKQELDKLVADGIIAPVTEPTDWVSSVLAVPKKNGTVRICLDPKDLNKAIKRSHYPLPTIEDMSTQLNNAKVFSVLDAKCGFWQVKLEEKSSHFTTFNTPFGRFRWLRMPFGINSAPEVFQRKMNEAIEGLQGIHVIADDFLVVGYGDTYMAAVRNHDENLASLLARCQKLNLTLNPEKVKLRQTEVPFVGHLLTAQGFVADPEKVRAIRDMPTPTDVASLKRFLGMVNYLAKYLPHLSSVAEPLRRLEHKEAEWCWCPVHDNSVNTIKNLICKAPVLKFYDVKQDVTVECDASQTGLGATLLQEGHPVAFASRALTPAETRYAQIEKELLAVVFACEKFDTFLYGKELINVKTDHQPLESIFKKDLCSSPKRLQRMLLRLQRYNLSVKYQKGAKMVMSDPLSRAYLDDLPDDDNVFCNEVQEVIMVDDLPISQERLTELREAAESDGELQMLMATVLDGWPQSQAEVPQKVKPYFQCRDEIIAQNGLLFKGDRLIIPLKLRKKMMEAVHSSHIGIEGCLRRAREVFYWPLMNAELKDFIKTCSICNSLKPEQTREPFMSHEIPMRPWQKVGTDLFQLDDRVYLVTADYYSSFFEVDKLEHTNSRTVIEKLKMHFSRHGIPEIVISDNGPQFSSAEFAKFAKEWNFKHSTSSPNSTEQWEGGERC